MSTADSDAVRRLLYGGSTRSGTLSTGDIDWFVDNAPNVWLAAAEAASAESSVNLDITSKSVGDLRIEYGDRAANFKGLAAQYRRKGISKVTPFAGGTSRADKTARESDTDRVQSEVKVGVHDFEST
jgi:hypothetical protein